MSTDRKPATRGRPRIDPAAKARAERRRVLDQGLVACYEIIEMIRNEKAELAAAELGRKS